MNLAVFERMSILANGAFSIEGIPVERSDKTGMAKLFEALFARVKRASSAASEMRKTIGVPAYGGENRL